MSPGPPAGGEPPRPSAPPAPSAPSAPSAPPAPPALPTLPAPSALPVLDPVIHAQPRLRVTVTLATLADGDRITFPRLQELAGMTAGNLATHLKKLEDAGYVRVTKAYRRRTPVTWLSLTTSGRLALEEYTAALQTLLANASPGPDRPGPDRPGPDRHEQQSATPG
jgi:DNA-binding transcriptional ArsR family regulator